MKKLGSEYWRNKEVKKKNEELKMKNKKYRIRKQNEEGKNGEFD